MNENRPPTDKEMAMAKERIAGPAKPARKRRSRAVIEEVFVLVKDGASVGRAYTDPRIAAKIHDAIKEIFPDENIELRRYYIES